VPDRAMIEFIMAFLKNFLEIPGAPEECLLPRIAKILLTKSKLS